MDVIYFPVDILFDKELYSSLKVEDDILFLKFVIHFDFLNVSNSSSCLSKHEDVIGMCSKKPCHDLRRQLQLYIEFYCYSL